MVGAVGREGKGRKMDMVGIEEVGDS